MARAHSLSTYRDGYSKVEFCQNCGAEGAFMLAQECVTPEAEKQLSLFENAVDNGTLQP